MVKLATICYIDNGKEFLLLHRNKKPNDVHAGKWIGVGGKLEKGETPQECAVREILGAGSVFGFAFLPATFNTLLFILPPGAFLTLGCLMAVFNKVTKKKA